MRQTVDRRQTWFLLMVMGIMISLVAAGCAKKVQTASQTVSPEENVTSAPPSAEEPQREERPAIKEGDEASPETLKPGSSMSLEDIHFDYDKSAIRPDVKAILEKHAKWLQSNPRVKIQIEGHSDERGTNEYNLVLGERRAQATKRFLIAMGVDGKRLATISYGEERPLCTEHGESCYSKNRRVHFVIER